MHPEVLKIKKDLNKSTSQEKKWTKLIEKNSIHPREEVIERWVKFEALFDEEEKDSMNKHYAICKECSRKRDNAFPLLEDLEKAS